MHVRLTILIVMSLLTVSVFGQQNLPAQGDDKTVSGSVVFPVNRYYIPANNVFLNHLQNDILPEMSRSNMRLKRVSISGAASPEGRRRHNEDLARQRNKALLDTISKLVSLPEGKDAVQLEIIIEDYRGLVKMLETNSDPYYEKVKTIVHRYLGKDEAQLKRSLQTIDRGRFWNYILRKYFPDLRKATVELVFEPVVPPVVVPKVEEPVVVEKDTVVPEPPVQPQTIDSISKPSPQPVTDTIIVQPKERIHLLSLKSNLLYDAFWMPQFGMAPVLNIHAEYYPLNGHFTYSLGFQSGYYHKWNKCKFFQIRDYKLEARYYLHPAKDNNAQYLGTYVSAYLHADKFGFGLGPDKGWKGEGGGAGLSLGYVKNISKNHRWRLEGFAALGFFICRYDPYVYGNPITGVVDGYYYYDYTGNVKSFKRRNHMFRNFIPQAGINITYDLLYRKTKSNGKKGISFKRLEPTQ